MDARPEEVPRTPKAADRRVQSLPEIGQIIRRTVGERLVSLSPDVLRRIEFGCVRREVMDVEARVVREEGPNLAAAVDGAAIPEQVHGAAQVPEQVLEERADVEASEIAGATAEIERQAPPLGRHRHPAADREAVVPVAVPQIRRLPSGRPGPAHVGDEQKTALIDEDEMGATSSGVFLSGAIPHASSAR